MSYSLLDSGKGKKLERFGDYIIERPCSQAIWQPRLKHAVWKNAHATFWREPKNMWRNVASLPKEWDIMLEGVKLKIAPTDFGHMGIFPEHSCEWSKLREIIRVEEREELKVLNLFAYSGGATMAVAMEGAVVTHVDASKGMIDWAKENARRNGLEKAPIRWIVDDVMKFLKRESRRGNHYDAIILDPPTFGRGARGEVFKIEEDIIELLQLCHNLLSEKPLFILLSCHTPGYTPVVLRHLVEQMMEGTKGAIKSGEMCLPCDKGVFEVPSGAWARWYYG